jgi:hypothetical protein
MSAPDYNPPYSGESYFGVLRGGQNVDNAIISIFDQYLGYYTNEVARTNEEPFERLVPIKSFRVTTDLEAMPEDRRAPLVLIVNNGLDDPPIRSAGPGVGYSYTGIFEYDVGIMAVAKGQREHHATRAIRLAWLYATAVVGCLIQQRDDDKVISMVDFKDLRPNGLDSSADRTACMVVATFLVTVPNMASWGTGPLLPDWVPAEPPAQDESPEWPVATHPTVTVEKVPLNDPLEEEV